MDFKISYLVFDIIGILVVAYGLKIVYLGFKSTFMSIFKASKIIFLVSDILIIFAGLYLLFNKVDYKIILNFMLIILFRAVLNRVGLKVKAMQT
ncbi:MAG: hypothetical protein GXZ08_08605 [Tissierellia bacterium]|nr:hypothetical protein [Tissierellia bacterium]